MAYATSTEYEVFAGGTPPDDLARLLERASEVIDDNLRTAWFPVDSKGLPTNADHIAAFRDATCAQVEFWSAGDEEDDVLGPVKDISFGTVKATPADVYVLAPRASRILRNAGLYRREPVSL